MILSPRLSWYSQQTTPHSCPHAWHTSRHTLCLLRTKMGCSKLFLQQVGELGHGQPSKFLELVTSNHAYSGLEMIGTHQLTMHTMVHLAEPDLELVEEKISCTFEEIFQGLTPTIHLLLRCKTTSSRGLKRIVL